MTPEQLKELRLIQNGLNRLEKRLEKVRYQLDPVDENQLRNDLYEIGQIISFGSVKIGLTIENNEK